jgi:hypothetical protein
MTCPSWTCPGRLPGGRPTGLDAREGRKDISVVENQRPTCFASVPQEALAVRTVTASQSGGNTMASELETKIQKAAEAFAHTVLGTLETLTLAEIAGLVQGVGTAVVERVKGHRARPGPKPGAKEAVARKAAPAKPAATRKLTISPARAKQLKVQGTYIGLMRSLPAGEKAKIKAIAAKRGMAAAVAVMRKR